MGKILVNSSIITVLVAFGIQILLSEVLTGWTKQYTSPIYFTPSKSIPDMTGKVAIVTGSNTGIGYVTALELARAGANVIVAARSEVKGLDAVRRIKQEINFQQGLENTSDKVQFLGLNLASLDSVENFVESFQDLNMDLHILVLNAGVMKSPGMQFVGEPLTYGFETTQDGFEYHVGVNHIGHAHLTQMLLGDLKSTAAKSPSGSRIVSVSSFAESGAPESGMVFDQWVPQNGIMPETYEDGLAYGQSKLANLMYARELSSQLNGTGVSAYACHPGIIATELTRYMDPVMQESQAKKGYFERLPGQVGALVFQSALFDAYGGALTQLHLATASEDTLVNGANYHPIGKDQDRIETLQPMQHSSSKLNNHSLSMSTLYPSYR